MKTAEPTLQPVERAERHLRQWLRRNPGQQLPTELALSKELGVARNTLRNVLKTLEAQGLVECLGRRQGRRAVDTGTTTSQLLARTVAIVSSRHGDLEQHERTGWLRATEAGAMAALRESGLYGLLMDDRGLNSGPAVFGADQPYGVLVFHGAGTREQLESLRHQGIPLVIYGGDQPDIDTDRVLSDQRAGCRLLTRELLASGCTRVLRLWSRVDSTWWLDQRNAGYEDAIHEAGAECLPAVGVSVRPDRSPVDFDERLRLYAGRLAEHLTGDRRVDGILATTDRDVYYIAAAVRLFGLEPGRNVRICGYDNIWSQCEERTREPSLPWRTIDKQNDLAGREMVRMLRERIAGRLPEAEQHLTVAPQIVRPDIA